MNLSDLKIDKTWTLFLDRDGVINLLYPNDYVKHWSEFYFLEGVLDGIKSLSKKFRRIIIITNQQGVGKGLMTEEDLTHIHNEMRKEITKYGGRIHAIYTANALKRDDYNNMRKPAIGMALQAKRDFPEINFQKSLMVGDMPTDMEFGRNAGMVTVFVGDPHRLEGNKEELADIRFDSLAEFANALA